MVKNDACETILLDIKVGI